MDAEVILPVLGTSGYYTVPSLDELLYNEKFDPGYCSRVPNFVVGKVGYGHVKFLGDTDVRRIDLDEIVNFDRHSVTIYPNESSKPPIGQGLNKPAEVTLVLQPDSMNLQTIGCRALTKKLLNCTSRQGALFVSFEPSSGEWKFLVEHFSRFGLIDHIEEDDAMHDTPSTSEVTHPPTDPFKETYSPELSQSLPSNLRLNPSRMQETRMLMFPEDMDEDIDGGVSSGYVFPDRAQISTESPYYSTKDPMQMTNKTAILAFRKHPQQLLEYNPTFSGHSDSRGIFMTGQNKGQPVKMAKIEGFKQDNKSWPPLSGKTYSSCIADAALFMGRSFRVGWGPNGILVHAGSPVSSPGCGLSSVINIEKVASDKVVRDKDNNTSEELVDVFFSSVMTLHNSLEHEFREIELGPCKLKLQRVVASRFVLPEICNAYVDIVERQLEVIDLPNSLSLLLNHQVSVWKLIKVLFSERVSKLPDGSDGEDMLTDVNNGNDSSTEIDLEALPLIRRAEFSDWLKDNVMHHAMEDDKYLDRAKYLEQILLALSCRQVITATKLAVSNGDVRLAILLSQASGSMVNRADIARQLKLWRINGLDYNMIERDRLKLYELLAGNVEGALEGNEIDWKRYLGMIMWYELPPDTSLDVLFHTYQTRLTEQIVPYPDPMYVEEGPLGGVPEGKPVNHFDMSYYLMLLHANKEDASALLKPMFSTLSSSYDPLDYHMIWHQRSILEAIGLFSSNDLHLLDMSFIDQLLHLGKCHWAIYVVLHMPYFSDAPYFQAAMIKEILSRYCESWSKEEVQKQFIEELGVPTAWMEEALAVYHEYYGDEAAALEHYIACGNWQKAHRIFMTSIAHYLFLSGKSSEVWRITSSMEEHKHEIADWDLGAGIFVDYYIIRNFMLEESTMNDSDVLQERNTECRKFFARLKDSLATWKGKVPIGIRAAFSKMADEFSRLLMNTPGSNSTQDIQVGCFETILNAPVPEDRRACHLQEAVAFFTDILSQEAN